MKPRKLMMLSDMNDTDNSLVLVSIGSKLSVWPHKVWVSFNDTAGKIFDIGHVEQDDLSFIL